ncbi:MAG TPA: hypothetical protein VHE33_18775 [Acidobacteriaceae bacterium]|nr:hypothetical protein [Acidobacteriaceae bacterium]
MATTKFSRERLPDKLLSAKAEAVSAFLSSEPVERTLAFAATSRPEHNVVGVGIGPKMVKGKPTSGYSVRFYVVSKIPLSAIKKDHVLPSKVKGMSADVVEVGVFRAFAVGPTAEQKRRRPARPGSSIGFQFPGSKATFVMAGTFGAVVTDGSNRLILSNIHVLADENNLSPGASIFQPGLLDGGSVNRDEIATLSKFVPLDFSAPNLVDCALAAVDRANLISAAVLPKVGKLASAVPVPAVVGMKVHKTGRTTGYRTGVVFDVSADVKVGYEGGTAVFQNQVLIKGDTAQSFSDAGDSGSLIVDRATKRATALLFAGSASHTIGNHISDVLSALDVTLVV